MGSGRIEYEGVQIGCKAGMEVGSFDMLGLVVGLDGWVDRMGFGSCEVVLYCLV